MRKNIKIYQEIQGGKIAKVKLIVLCGSQQEKKNENGVTHFLEHMNLYFAEKEEFAINIQGTTDFECTQYEIQCNNDYNQVIETLKKMYAIINGSLLIEDNMKGVKEAVINEIKFQRKAPYYQERNRIIRYLLPQYWEDKMPVGNEDVIRKLSFEQIVDYQNKNYNDIAICVSSNFKIYKTAETDGTIPILRGRYNRKEKSSLFWEIDVHKKEKVICNLYFESQKNFQNTIEYLKYEFIKMYFFIFFDEVLGDLLLEAKMPVSEAILYENEILADLVIIDYEFVTLNTDILFIKKMVLVALERLEQQKKKNISISSKAANELKQKINSINFEEKCKLNFLYGIDLDSGIEIERLQKEIVYEEICEIAKKYRRFHIED